MKISIIQSELIWHKPEQNFQRFRNHISQVDDDTDVIVLPEMWSSGFTMKAHQMYADSDNAIQLMKKWSLEKSACIIGSLIVKSGEHFFNRLYGIEEGEIIFEYDKRHLFAYAGEDRIFQSGSEKKIVNIKDWNVCVNICYDLRFPEWSRNLEDYDALIYCANWPIPRIEAWDALLKARAIENQAYVIAANCVGQDVWHNKYNGHSSIYSFDGKLMDQLVDNEGIVKADIRKNEMLEYRQKLPFLKERDQYRIEGLSQ